MKCIFPFKYDGNTFERCTNYGISQHNPNSSWCSIKVDENKHHVRNNWQDCQNFTCGTNQSNTEESSSNRKISVFNQVFYIHNTFTG